MEEPAVTVRRATRTPAGTTVVLAESGDGSPANPSIRTEAVHLSTSGPDEFWDLTDVARAVVERAGVRHGQLTVYTPHTTTSVVINESETGFLNDFRRTLEDIVPRATYYEHDDHAVRTENLQEDEFINGHAHVRQLLVGHASVTVPVVDGELLLGQWQRVMFVELDQARERRVFIHAQGA